MSPSPSPGPIEAGAAPTSGCLDLVTVVYGAEIPLLRLQARSIDRMLAQDGIGSIFVLVNDRAEEDCVARTRAMLPDYGAFAKHVQILRPDDLFALRPARFRPRGALQKARSAFTANRQRWPFGVKGGWRGNRGWSIQQALKLAIARRGDGSNLLILDAKNHFIRPVGKAAFVAADGRPRARLETPNRKHLAWNRACYRLMRHPAPKPDAPSLPTLTPFVVGRRDLLAALEAVEARVGPVETFFARNRGRESEFALINAVLANRAGGLAATFAPGLKPAANIRLPHDDARVDRVLSSAESGDADILSVHKRRLGRISPAQLARLRRIWAEAGLDAEELISADAALRTDAHG